MPCLEEEEEEELAPEEKSSSNFPPSLSFPSRLLFCVGEKKTKSYTLFPWKKRESLGVRIALYSTKSIFAPKNRKLFLYKTIVHQPFRVSHVRKSHIFPFWDRARERCSQAIIMSYSRYLACALPGHYKRIAHLQQPPLLLLFGS